uniref:Tyrosine specific protein phosphatases domain-containing protein n=1 Tax=Caulobacter sp. (strain K31) TaxID=366602 RepID=B0SYC4_CAUSK
MTLLVCPLSQVETARTLHRPSHLVSLLSPTSAAKAWPEADANETCLRLAFHDVVEAREGLTPPDAALVARLLDFAARWDAAQPLLVHCWAGVSRSTAAAFIIACQYAPERPERHIAQALRAAAPYATPNPLMVSLADAALSRAGRMSAAIAEIGRGAEAFEGALFELPLG